MKKLKYVKLFENFSKSYSVDSNFGSENIGGSIMIGKDLEFNIDLSKELENIGVDLEKLTPYVLKIGNEVNLDSNGKIHINDHHYHQDTIKNDVAVFDTIDDFIEGIGYEKDGNDDRTWLEGGKRNPEPGDWNWYHDFSQGVEEYWKKSN